MTGVLVAVDSVIAAAFVLLAAAGGRYRDRPGATTAGLLWLSLAGVASALALGRVDVLSGRTVVAAIILGWLVAVPLWAGFTFSHTGRGPQVARRGALLAVAYALVVGAVTLYGSSVGGATGQLVRVVTSVLQTVLLGVGFFGVFLVVRSAVTDDLPVRRAVVLSLGGLGVSLFLFSVSYVQTGDPEALPAVPTYFLCATAGCFALGVFRFRLFSETPGTGPLARRTVFEEMGEAVVVVDRERRLVDANEVAEAEFGVTVASDAGRTASSVLGFDVEDAAGTTATVRTTAGRRTFDVSTSVLTNRRGDAVGASYLLRDVTDRQAREQRLEVLNRVLRHNLRNDLDAIRGFAEALSDGAVDDTGRAAARIRATADDLVDVGETVERADHLMTRDSLEHRPVDLAALVEDVVTDVRERYDCSPAVATDAGGQPLRTDRAVLRTALVEVVENAVEHSDQPKPSVTVDLTRTEDGARIAVRDDGPGIPERERAVLLDGEEGPLQHGTGVGLWFVSWAVTRLGGDLSFGDGDGTGSEVVLDVPDRAADAVESGATG